MNQTEGTVYQQPEFLEMLLEMGIDKDAALEGLRQTGYESVESALNYIFNSIPTSDISNAVNTSKDTNLDISESSSDESDCESEKYYKMTFIVNGELKMGLGKIAAQVGHACLGLYRQMQRNNMTDILDEWERIGEKKIVLKGRNDIHLEELYQLAQVSNVPAYLVHDAGHTQVAPGSTTVLSLFGLEEDIDKIAGKLRLL